MFDIILESLSRSIFLRSCCFVSTSAHGWPISDCTGEGLKATICLLKSKTIQKSLKDESLKKISDKRLYKAVNILLTYQNEDGGEYMHAPCVVDTDEYCFAF